MPKNPYVLYVEIINLIVEIIGKYRENHLFFI